MANRDATDTITGYFYQFDKTILEILNQSNLGDSVEVEGIEDIDIHSTDETKAIQCKYHSKLEYNHSEIKKPITLMVRHFAKSTPSDPPVRYHLYGHFNSGQDKLGEINLDKLKNNLLTYRRRKDDGKGGKTEEVDRVYEELGLDDSTLQKFLSRLSIDINAPSFEEQYTDIIGKIRSELKVNKAEAELYHYNSALKAIRDISVQQDRAKRIITKKDFVDRISAQDEVFDSWYIRRKGRGRYIRSIKSQHLSSGLNMELSNRFFLIDCSDHPKSSAIKEVIYAIAKKWSKISTRQKPCFCPSIYIHGVEAEEVTNMKNEMYSEQQQFVDGFPFFGSELSTDHFYTNPSVENGIKFRIVNTLSDLRVLLSVPQGTLELYEFYNSKRFFEFDRGAYKAIKIEDISYVKDMMT